MLAWAPGYIPADTTITTLVRNIDVAPTMLDLTDTRSLETVDGRSFRPFLEGRSSSQDRDFLYEYYWEYAFPQTPTTFALRGDRYKLIMYHGIWDQNEFYDLKADPIEQHNLIHNPTLQDTIQAFQERLFERLRATDGMQIPLRPMGGWQAGERLRDAE
jgi:N-acetylglucosamine-6-sulfatase